MKDMKPGTIPKGSGSRPSVTAPPVGPQLWQARRLGHDAKGIRVVEQWSGTSPKAAAKIRGGGVIKFKGTTLPDDQSGPSPHMSNMGEYYYLVLDKR